MQHWKREELRTGDSKSKIPFWTVPVFREYGFFAGFTTRWGGVSDGNYQELNLGLSTGDQGKNVWRNRETVLAAVPADVPSKIQLIRQVHGADVIEVQEPSGDMMQPGWWIGPEADGQITRSKLTLGMLYADCLPVYIIDPVSGGVALGHAGWRSLTAGVIENLFSLMYQLWSTLPSNCLAALGPSIERSAYQVDAPVVNALSEWAQWWRHVTYPSDMGKVMLDMDKAAYYCLTHLGVPGDSIFVHPKGTFFSDDFYSHRRDGTKTGRCMALLVSLNSSA